MKKEKRQYVVNVTCKFTIQNDYNSDSTIEYDDIVASYLYSILQDEHSTQLFLENDVEIVCKVLNRGDLI